MQKDEWASDTAMDGGLPRHCAKTIDIQRSTFLSFTPTGISGGYGMLVLRFVKHNN